MNAEQAWSSVLGQLQMEMPRAAYDTWVRDTRLFSYEDGVMNIAVRNAYARAPDAAQRKALAEQVQLRLSEVPSFAHLGQFNIQTGFKSTLSGVTQRGRNSMPGLKMLN